MPEVSGPGDPSEAVRTAWRADSARLVGALTRMTRDVELASDLVQDAVVAALEQWPKTGVPDNPTAWLMTTAQRRGIDHFRRAETLNRKIGELEHDRPGEDTMVDLENGADFIQDDVLRLIFLCAHPGLSEVSRAALTLRLVGGLTTGEIARGFLTTETTMGQRISRAKKSLTKAGSDFELPTGGARTQRLDDVMAVIYLIFNEGYSATAGQDWMRPALATEAIRLARLLNELTPDEPEALGLQALLELQASRFAARLDDHGEPVLLEAQDRRRWDHSKIQAGMASLQRARELAAMGKPVGSYYLQAEIAAQHATAARAEDTNWRRIATLYDLLADVAPGPVIEVNRAVAHGRAFGPAAGLTVLDAIDAQALDNSPLIPSVRGDLLEQSGLHTLAAKAFKEAVELSGNAAERGVLRRRRDENLAHSRQCP